MNEDLRAALSSVSHGDHCCLIFDSELERVEVTVPFLAAGLERDERSLFVGDEDAIEQVRWGLKSAGVDVERESRKNRLILSSDRGYLDGDRWKTERMLEFLEAAYGSAMAEGFSALRAAGDVSWQVGPEKDYKEIVHYEALLDLFFAGKRMVGMCQYPRNGCPPETLSGILSSHKIAAVNAELCSNFHYAPPQLLLEKDPEVRQRKLVDWMTSQLLRARRAEEAREKAVQELVEEKRELERVSRERSLLQEQLLQSQKMEAIGRLAGGVAHDFNNVLTAILGLSELLLASPALDGAIKSDIREIKLAGERAAALTRQLLALSRRRIIQPKVLNLNEVLQGMERFLRRLIGANIEFKTFLSPGLGNVKADPGQIEQVVMNLAVNAADAMPSGGNLSLETGDVELGEDYAEAHPEVRPGPHVMLAVSDTGHGMDPATCARIFEPFFTTKESGRGTGLGLSTVHGIVRQSGGSIFVYSEPGKGSVFKIYLPRVDEEPDALPAPRRHPASLQGTETVLLVEDDDMVGKLVHRVLADSGYTVLRAMSFKEAVKFCERHKGLIHLMITDVILPEMSGRELAKQVGPLRPRMKILFMSGYADEAVIHHGLLGDDAAFLEKPFTQDDLVRKVREVLDKKDQASNL